MSEENCFGGSAGLARRFCSTRWLESKGWKIGWKTGWSRKRRCVSRYKFDELRLRLVTGAVPAGGRARLALRETHV